jgi:hypothetical protein
MMYQLSNVSSIVTLAPIGLNIDMRIFGHYDDPYNKDSKGKIQRSCSMYHHQPEKLFYVSPSTRTEYGDVISDDTIMQIITEYKKYPNPDISQKWNNTLVYFNSVKSRRI